MNWLFFALLAPALDTIILFIDRYIIEQEVPDYRGLPIFGAIFGCIAGTLFWIATGYPFLGTRDAAIILTTGVLSVWGLALYYKALSLEETSRIIIFFKAIPVFILLLSFLLLHETISIKQFIGFIVILTSVIGASLKPDRRNQKKTVMSSGLMLILLVDMLWAVSAVLVKFAINLNSFSKILSYESWGVGLGGISLYFLFPTIRKAFLKTIRTVSRTALALMMANEVIFLISKTITFYAYSLGPAALISVIGGIQVFYGVTIGLILTLISPKTFHEDIRSKTLVQKIIYAMILVFGIYLVS